MNDLDQSHDVIIEGKKGRDAGKRFLIKEVVPVTMAGFVLRLLSALNLAAQDDLFAFLQPSEEGEDLASIMRLLTGCDPVAVHALINDALTYVDVAADPQHPGMFRRLQPDDIREMSTLGDVLGAFARTNLLPG